MARRTYWAEFARHCLKFYIAYPEIVEFNTTADKMNWQAAKDALAPLSLEQRELVTKIYAGRDTVADEIYNVATERKINQTDLWVLVRKVERAVAENRNIV